MKMVALRFSLPYFFPHSFTFHKSVEWYRKTAILLILCTLCIPVLSYAIDIGTNTGHTVLY